jgi:rhodanese-related sulfurtransferase
MMAAGFLEQNGVAGVLSLAGGIDAWSSEVDPRMARY